MSSFTKPLSLTEILKTTDTKFLWIFPDKIVEQTWVTDRAFTYKVGSEDSDDSIRVPKGFITDLASVPFPFSMLVPKSGVYNQAAVLHDYLYQSHVRTKKESDSIFLEAMLVLGVNKVLANVMYWAVVRFGLSPWKKGPSKLPQKAVKVNPEDEDEFI